MIFLIVKHIIFLSYLAMSFLLALLRVFKGKFYIYDEIMASFCSLLYPMKKADIPLPALYEYLYLKNEYLITDEFKRKYEEMIKK